MLTTIITIFDIAPNITTPIALLAFVVAAYFTYIKIKLNRDKQILQTLPNDDKSDVYSSYFEAYKIPNNKLGKKEQYETLMAAIKQKGKIRLYMIFLFAFIGILLSALIFFSEKPAQNSKLHGEIENRLFTIRNITNNNIKTNGISDIKYAAYGMKEKDQSYNYIPLFDEYKSFSLLKLIYLLNKKSNQTEKNANKKIKNAVSKLNLYLTILQDTTNRTKINLPNGKYTYEFKYTSNQKKEVEEEIIAPINSWLELWVPKKK